MPNPLEFFDFRFDQAVHYPADDATFFTLPLDTGWDPGDMRVVCIRLVNESGASGPNIGATPSGWIKILDVKPSNVIFYRYLIYCKRLVAGDVDVTITCDRAYSSTTAWTVHGAHRSTNPTANLSFGTGSAAYQPASLSGTNLSISTPVLGTAVHYFLTASVVENRPYVDWSDPSNVTKRFWSQDNFMDSTAPSDPHSYDYDAIVFTEERVGGGSTTAKTLTDVGADSVGSFFNNWVLFIPTDPDVTYAIGKATEADVARTTTMSLANLTTWNIGKATETDHVRQMWQPLNGMRVSNPIDVPDGRILGSRMLWNADVQNGSTLTVETSIDYGATWQVARSNHPIPRMTPGLTGVRALMTRVTITRGSTSIPSPVLHRLETIVGIDTSVDELKPIGVFLINDTDINDTVEGVKLTISGVDLSYQVSRNKWDDIFTMRSNRNYGDVIKAIISNRLPGTIFNFQSTPHKAGRIVLGADNTDGDPWADAQQLAESIGMEIYFDPTGICTMREEPNPDVAEAVWEFSDRAKPTITELSRGISNADVYNQVVIIGDGTYTPAPIRVVKSDDDPASATYVKGRYGVVTKVVRDTAIITYRQARDMATGMIRRVKGLVESADIQAVPNPALEPGDVVRVTRGPSKVEGQFIIDSMTIPLASTDTMRFTARRQRLG